MGGPYFSIRILFPAYLRKMTENMIEKLSNIDSKDLRARDLTGDLDANDKYRKRGRVLIESPAIQFVNYHSIIIDAHEAE